MGTVSTKIEENKNLISSISQPLAVIGLDKIGQKVAGKLLTPAVWAANYAVNGNAPDKTDVGLFGVGLLGGAAAPASITTGLVKAAVDDDMDQRLKIIQSGEKPTYRKFIKPCFRFASGPPQINAMNIASLGGTAWQHKNGLWVYITDAKNHHVPNFKPNNTLRIYQPVWPLKPLGNGKYRFTQHR